MNATYRLKVDEITEGFVKILKEVYKDKEIEITIQEAEDETTYLLKSEANRKQLLQAIADVKDGKPGHIMTMEEFEQLMA